MVGMSLQKHIIYVDGNEMLPSEVRNLHADKTGGRGKLPMMIKGELRKNNTATGSDNQDCSYDRHLPSLFLFEGWCNNYNTSVDLKQI